MARLHPPRPAAVTGPGARPREEARRGGIQGAGGVCKNSVNPPSQISFAELVMWGEGERVCEQEINLTQYEMSAQ